MAPVAAVRERARDIARGHRARPDELATLAVGQALAGDAQLAFELFRASPRAVLTLSRRRISSMLPVLHDWCSTDCFGCFVSGVAWREGRLDDAVVLRWSASRSLWTRRASLVSTIPLNCRARGARKPRGEARRTLAVCSRLIDDRDDMIVKAMSWALRELARRDRNAVVRFLAQHRERLAPRVVRETTSKLTTGLKSPRRRRSA